ncbi:MAG: ornithine cyclodeaminase family protein [Bacillota bacterium]|nr:ornithine cyclodeaminase family protein [Bacillota bacterium]
MLYLNSLEIEKLSEEVNFIKSLEKGFKLFNNKEYKMPERMHLDRGEDTILYMPCLTDETIGTKIISLFPENKDKNIPVINGIMLLNHVETGVPKAILDGSSITAYRTGALGGIGIKYTSGKNCKNVGLIGPGVQGFHQLLFAAKARNLENIYVYGRNKDNLNQFIEDLKKKLPYIRITASKNPEELVKNSEIIITATPSETPVMPNDKELLKGKHIIAIGSYKYKMREIPDALYELLDEVYIDTELAIEESGDIIQPLEKGLINEKQIKTLSEIMSKEIDMTGRTTLFKCVGMALLDVVVAEEIYKKALELNIGTNITT